MPAPFLTGLLTAALALALAGTADAAVRSGSVTDPRDVGEASFDPNTCYVPDISGLSVAYNDTAGTVRVTWSYYTDIAHYCGSAIGPEIVELSSNGGANPTPKAEIKLYVNKWSDSSWRPRAWLEIDGIGGSLSTDPTAPGGASGQAVLSPDGHSVTVEFSHAALAQRDWRFVEQNQQFSWDKLAPFWFEGYAPLDQPGDDVAGGDPGTTKKKPTTGTVGVSINAGAKYTNTRDVELTVVAPGGAANALLSNDGGFADAKRFPVAATIPWTLESSGPEKLPKIVYVRFGASTQTFTDDIVLDETDPVVEKATLAPSAAAAAASAMRSFRIRLSARDLTSGVGKAQVAVSKSRPGALRNYRKTVIYRGNQTPRYVRVRDRAGNFSRWHRIRARR